MWEWARQGLFLSVDHGLGGVWACDVSVTWCVIQNSMRLTRDITSAYMTSEEIYLFIFKVYFYC